MYLLGIYLEQYRVEADFTPMSKNTSGSDNSNESEVLKQRDTVSQTNAADAVIGGANAQGNQEKYVAQKAFDNQNSTSGLLKSKQPDETDEQYKQRVKSLEENSFEIINADAASMLDKYGPKDAKAQNESTHTPPIPKPAEPEYIPGYTEQEAFDRQHEILQHDRWTSEEAEFLRQMQLKKEGKDPTAEPAESATPANQADTPKPPEGKAEQEPFKLDAQAEEVKWQEWQERLNKEVFRKLEQLLAQHPEYKPPLGARVDLTLTVTNDGRVAMNYRYSDRNYANLATRALNETLHYHPELKKFPEGTTKTEIERKMAFEVKPGAAGYDTGEVESEIRKK